MKKCLRCNKAPRNPKIGFLCERHEQEALDSMKKLGAAAMAVAAIGVFTVQNVTSINKNTK